MGKRETMKQERDEIRSDSVLEKITEVGVKGIHVRKLARMFGHWGYSTVRERINVLQATGEIVCIKIPREAITTEKPNPVPIVKICWAKKYFKQLAES